ncbi:butyrate kinase [Cloacibacillus evryensis]|uniref:butyrate kinase n=1 Tax=Cloacibacillus evryensis TaxID=508460 RepID=UPI003AB1FF38
MRIFALNPGTTGIKAAMFEEARALWTENIDYPPGCAMGYASLDREAEEMIRGAILAFLASKSVHIRDIAAFVGRGGLLHPISGGTWTVNEAMLADLRSNRYGSHASNLGAIMASRLADDAGGKPAFTVDPVVVDEMIPEARISGMPEIPRYSIFHALNQKAVARRAAAQLGKKVEECSFIVAHIGGGITVGAHRSGRVIDVNNALGGYGPMTPDRAGTLHILDLARMCFSGRYTFDEIKKKIVGGGGLRAYLGTNDFREIMALVKSGDERAALLVRALALQISGEIAARAAALCGRVEMIILTGGLAFDEDLCAMIEERVGWIAPLMRIPGEGEMQALAEGALRVLRGEEEALVYERE